MFNVALFISTTKMCIPPVTVPNPLAYYSRNSLGASGKPQSSTQVAVQVFMCLAQGHNGRRGWNQTWMNNELWSMIELAWHKHHFNSPKRENHIFLALYSRQAQYYLNSGQSKWWHCNVFSNLAWYLKTCISSNQINHIYFIKPFLQQRWSGSALQIHGLTPIEPEAYALALAQQSNTVLWCTGLIQSATILLLNTVMKK